VRVLIWSSMMRERQNILELCIISFTRTTRDVWRNLLLMEVACWVYDLLHTHTNPVCPFLPRRGSSLLVICGSLLVIKPGVVKHSVGGYAGYWYQLGLVMFWVDGTFCYRLHITKGVVPSGMGIGHHSDAWYVIVGWTLFEWLATTMPSSLSVNGEEPLNHSKLRFKVKSSVSSPLDFGVHQMKLQLQYTKRQIMVSFWMQQHVIFC